MKKTHKLLILLALVCTLVVCCMMSASAEETHTEGYYTYTVTDGKATITDVDTAISGEVVIPDKLGGYPVTNIGANAFYNCINITKVSIPATVTAIGNYAFEKCKNLTDVTIADGVTSFGYEPFRLCGSITKLSVPVNYNYSLLPDALTSNLKEVVITNSGTGTMIKKYYNGAYTRTPWYKSSKNGNELKITIENGIKNIADYVFAHCENLTEVIIPESVEEIGDCSFKNCKKLTSVVLPDKVKTIGESAFYSCSQLSDVNMPKNLETIGDSAFLYVTFTDVVLPDKLKTIGTSAFAGSITSIVIPQGVTYIGKYNFGGSDITVHFEDTRSEWDSFGISLSSTAKLYCYDGPMENHTHTPFSATYGNNSNVRCTENWELIQCCKCGYTMIKEMAPIGHQEEKVPAIAPTCNSYGYSEGKRCTICKEYTVEPILVKRTGHKFTKYTSSRNATCTSDGTKWAQCDNINNYFRCTARDVIPDPGSKLPHADNDHDGKCDKCGTDTTAGCGHLCHKGGFWYKFCLFFWKLFKMNRYCSCGMAHY